MEPRTAPSGHVRSVIDNTAWRDAAYLTCSMAAFMAFLTLYTAYFYIQVFDEVHHLSSLSFAPYTVTLMNVGSFIGRLLPMYLSDKWGVINVTSVMILSSAVLLFGWMGVHNLGGLVVFAII